MIVRVNQIYAQVRSQVGDPVQNQVGDIIWGQLSGQCRSTVLNRAIILLWDKVRNTLRLLDLDPNPQIYDNIGEDI